MNTPSLILFSSSIYKWDSSLLASWLLHCAPRPEVIKLFSCSTQLRMKLFCLYKIKYYQFKLSSCTAELSMKFFLLINIKMPTIVGILIFISRKNFMLNWLNWLITSGPGFFLKWVISNRKGFALYRKGRQNIFDRLRSTPKSYQLTFELKPDLISTNY